MQKVKLEEALTVAINGFKIVTYDKGITMLPDEAVEAMVQQGKGEIILEEAKKETKDITEYEQMKLDATALGLEFRNNISKKELSEMISEATSTEG